MEENKLVSCIDKIYEMRDGMEFSLKQVEQLASYNDELANIIARAKGTKNNFKELVKETKDDVIGYKNQKEVFKEKIAYANAIIEYYEKGHKQDASEEDKKTADFVEQIVTTIFLLLSVVPTENEQRIEKEKKEAEAKRLKEEKEAQARNVKA
jgi:hypothetical protein